MIIFDIYPIRLIVLFMIDQKRTHFRSQIRQKAHDAFKHNVRKTIHFRHLSESVKYQLGLLFSRYTLQQITLNDFFHSIPYCFSELPH